MFFLSFLAENLALSALVAFQKNLCKDPREKKNAFRKDVVCCGPFFFIRFRAVVKWIEVARDALFLFFVYLFHLRLFFEFFPVVVVD